MSSTSLIKVGVVGFGSSAQIFHCPLIEAVPSMRLEAVLERSSNKSSAVYPGITVVRSLEDLLGIKELNLVVITTPNDSHHTIAKAALEAGKHVVVEKPFTVTSIEAEELDALARSLGLVLAVYHNRRWDGDFQTVKKLIESGTLGRIAEFESHFDRWRNYNRGGWKEADTPGTGILYDLGSHLIDQALTLFGPVKSVTAFISNQRQLPGSSIDDDFTLHLRHRSGVTSFLRATMLTLQQPALRFSVRGTKGTFIKHGLDPQEDQLKAGMKPNEPGFGIEAKEDEWGTLSHQIGDLQFVGKVKTTEGRYLGFYENVARAVAGETGALAVTASQAGDVIKIIEIAKKSNTEGRTIEL